MMLVAECQAMRVREDGEHQCCRPTEERVAFECACGMTGYRYLCGRCVAEMRAGEMTCYYCDRGGVSEAPIPTA